MKKYDYPYMESFTSKNRSLPSLGQQFSDINRNIYIEQKHSTTKTITATILKY